MASITHIILPGYEVATVAPRRRETVARALKRLGWRFRLPTICVIDGAPLLRARRGWARRRIRKGERVEFQSRPLGGGGSGSSSSSTTKSVVGLVGLIALSALAPGIGTWAAAAIGMSTVAGVSTAISAAVVAGGAFAVNTLVQPRPANAGQQAQTPLYAFGQQTNSARLMQTIPVRYGRTKVVPDFAAQPWTEYVGQDEYLNVLLVHGLGRYQRHRITIADAVLWDASQWAEWGHVSPTFSDVQVQLLEPGDTLTLFPASVTTAPGVSGQALDDPGVWVYGGITNPAGTSVNRLVFDFVLPQGCYIPNAQGVAGNFATHNQVQIRAVDVTGAPTGVWTTVVDEAKWLATKEPYRMSYSVDVAAGRYEVQARRVVASAAYPGAVDTIQWAAARGYTPGTQTFPGLTVTAIRMRATAQLTANAALRWGLEDTRILPVWTGSGWDDQPTRSPAYAAYDIATNTDYGCGRPLNKVDAQAVVTLAATAASRGDCFDYEFRTRVQATEALDTALAACRAKHRWIGDQLSLVRDQWVALPSMMITDGEIIRDSFSVDYLLQAEDAADAIIVEYLDETTWSVQEVQCPPDVVASNPVRVQIRGVGQRAHAMRECAFLWRQHTIRRAKPTATIASEGRLLALGSVVTLQSHVPQSWGASGEVVARAGTTLTLEPAASWGSGQHYIQIRRANAKPFGPIKVTRGSSDAEAVLDGADLALVQSQQGVTLDQALARRAGADPASWALGLGTAWQKRCIVLGGAPAGTGRTKLALVVDREDVHDDSGDPGDVPPAASFSDPQTPLVAGLTATLSQNVLEPVLAADWWPAAGARHYIAQISYDGRTSWAHLAQPFAPKLSQVVEPRALSLRVAAVGASGLPGAYSVVDLDAPTIDAMLVPGMDMVQGNRDLINNQLRGTSEQQSRDIDLLAGYVATLGAAVEASRLAGESRVTILAEAEGAASRALVQQEVLARVGADEVLAASISTVSATQNDPATGLSKAHSRINDEQNARASGDNALATRVQSVESALDGVNASVNVTWVTGAYPSGAAAGWQLNVKAQNVNAGLRAIARSDGTGYIAISADKLFIESPSGNPFAVFDTSSTGNVYIRADMYLDGSFTSNKFAAQSVTTNILTIGGVTTDRIYPQAVTNAAVTYYPTATGGQFGAVSITRIAGSYAVFEARFFPKFKDYINTSKRIYYYLEVRVVRSGPNGTSYSGATTYLLPIQYLDSATPNPGWQYFVGEQDIKIIHHDTDNLPAGTYEYRIDALNVLRRDPTISTFTVEESTFTAGFRDVYSMVTEYRR
ncbi:host specificity factor TipJ family phage tail protein [Aquabacter cavernae]|uniref:host specificity factor TipJ family phage tail protein n=1 Tax=Aquabacter cavernae TaxID=2496029 RepID=UPI000F8C6FBF|nr:host specificity factor TipJ family phage tail protein [Aquabacter cavernae]